MSSALAEYYSFVVFTPDHEVFIKNAVYLWSSACLILWYLPYCLLGLSRYNLHSRWGLSSYFETNWMAFQMNSSMICAKCECPALYCLSLKSEDLQNRLRRNNIRIFQIPEGSEGNDMAGFVKGMLRETLKLSPEMDIKIERSHWSLGPKPIYNSKTNL